ncbi:PqqD family peptide modification chaperone [Brevirhabdus sp.]|uniref:PqqD family peptide modification chaperone n=1 Tax=Brevirhabdus sp. TaxID=2004514 RepID=UPI004058E78A
MSAGSFLSADWYRAAPLRPRLRGHVEVHRQRFRGEVWHIVQDLHSGRYHRISPAGNYIISLMNGRRTLQKLWEMACERFEDDPPTQSEVIRLLSQLHSADLIAGDVPPDIAEMGRRHHEQEKKTMLSRLRNPLALRLPLFDPDRFLDATVWLVRPLFTVWGFLLWAALVLSGVTLAAMNWSALTQDVTGQILSAQNVALIALAFPLVKAIHEMGHAYATKVWGGEVHEIGVMFLVLIPVPYVDASASAAFANKWRRAVVGGAGIMVELALAALAMIFWLEAEPGLARAFAFNIMLIGGVSTLLFNGNPLLRFDGYFVMADLVEIPNLGQRANKYFWYVVQRHLLGVKDAESPVTARGERRWFLGYSILAFFYRISISVAISLFIATKFFFIGILLAIWALSNVFVFPIFKGLKYVLSSGSLRGRRLRAVSLTAGVTALVLGFVFLVPVPHATVADGFVLMQEDAILRAQTDGFVRQVQAESADVAAGDSIVVLDDPNLRSERRLAAARLAEMQLRLDSVIGTDRVQANVLREQIRHLQGRLALFDERRAALTLTAQKDERVLIPQAQDLIGMLVRKGTIMGYAMPHGDLRLRVAVPQATAELVRDSVEDVQIRLQRRLDTVLPGRIVAFSPEGQPILPSPALGTTAGGQFAVDPSDPQQRRTLQSLFLFDVATRGDVPPALVGERALVRFDHRAEPLGVRFYRSLRQLFLNQFNV